MDQWGEMEKGRREKLTSVQQPVSGDRANQAVLGGWPGAQGASVNSHVTTHHFSVEWQVETRLAKVSVGVACHLGNCVLKELTLLLQGGVCGGRERGVPEYVCELVSNVM